MKNLEKQTGFTEMKEYMPPRLVQLGSVIELTFGGPRNGGDLRGQWPIGG